MTASDHLNTPHGGELVDLLVSPERERELRDASRDWPSWDAHAAPALRPRAAAERRLLAAARLHGPAPTSTRSCERDAARRRHAVADAGHARRQREASAEQLAPGKPLALRDPEGVMLAVLHVEDVWHARPRAGGAAGLRHDRPEPTRASRTSSSAANPVYVGGRVEGVRAARRTTTSRRCARRRPRLRAEFARRGWRRIVAFQTRNPMHRAHFELTLRAARELEANLLAAPGRRHDQARRRRPLHARALLPGAAAPLPAAHREARAAAARDAHGRSARGGVARDHPQELRLHPLHRRSRPRRSRQRLDGRAVLRPVRRAGAAGASTQDELGIDMVPFQQMVYVEDRDSYVPEDEVAGRRAHARHLRHRAAPPPRRRAARSPTWFTFPEVAEELRRTHPPRAKQGFTVFFTGLSGAGKSTIAQRAAGQAARDGRPAGDRCSTATSCARTCRPSSASRREHRDINIRRIGFVASEITKNGGIAICAPIAPYDAYARGGARASIEPRGGFVLVHVATPIEVCEERDRKGLYAKARAGLLPGVHRHLRPVRGADERRDRHRHRATRAPRKPRSRSSCTSSARGISPGDRGRVGAASPRSGRSEGLGIT